MQKGIFTLQPVLPKVILTTDVTRTLIPIHHYQRLHQRIQALGSMEVAGRVSACRVIFRVLFSNVNYSHSRVIYYAVAMSPATRKPVRNIACGLRAFGYVMR